MWSPTPDQWGSRMPGRQHGSDQLHRCVLVKTSRFLLGQELTCQTVVAFHSRFTPVRSSLSELCFRKWVRILGRFPAILVQASCWFYGSKKLNREKTWPKEQKSNFSMPAAGKWNDFLCCVVQCTGTGRRGRSGRAARPRAGRSHCARVSGSAATRSLALVAASASAQRGRKSTVSYQSVHVSATSVFVCILLVTPDLNRQQKDCSVVLLWMTVFLRTSSEVCRLHLAPRGFPWE